MLNKSIISYSVCVIVGAVTGVIAISLLQYLLPQEVINIFPKTDVSSYDTDKEESVIFDGSMLQDWVPLKFPSLQNKESSCLFQTIKTAAPLMTVFPLDLILDEMQMEDEYFRDKGLIDITLFRNTSYVDTSQEKYYRYSISPELTIDQARQEYDLAVVKKDIRNIRKEVDRRYDLTFDRFIPFYVFYLSALNAKPCDIEECFDNFNGMTTKEKALALSALYIFEQCARKRRSLDYGTIKDRKYKYDDYRVNESISEKKWSSLISILEQCALSSEVAFDAVPNDNLIKEWELSFRINALLYQCNLAFYNPYFHPGRRGVSHEYWHTVCRSSPIEFLYAILLSETDLEFINSKKPFSRRSLLNSPPNLTNVVRLWREDEKNILFNAGNVINENDLKSDQNLLSTLHTQLTDYNDELFNNILIRKRQTTEQCALFMRAYLNTQFNFSRRFSLVLTASLFTLYDYETNKEVSKPHNAINANTSSEPKTLGYIANALLHSRSLFEDGKR